MKKSTKTMAAVLSVTTALMVSTAAMATENEDVMLISEPAESVEVNGAADAETGVVIEEATSEWFTIKGEVTEAADGMVVVKSEETEIALKASEETIVIDQVTGLPADFTAIAAGDIVSAQYGAAMTRSIPAQVVADMVVVNADQGTLANLISVDSVTENEDGTVTVFDETKSIELTIAAEAEISPYKTRNIVALSDIAEGCKLVAWYDFVTMSIPAQAYTEKVVLIPAPTAEVVEEPEEVAFVSVDGTVVTGAPIMREDAILVPVRAVAEALGFDVLWNGEDYSVTLVKDDISATVKIGEPGLSMGNARSAAETVVPELIEGKTYVGESLFTQLLGDGAVEISGGVINFISK